MGFHTVGNDFSPASQPIGLLKFLESNCQALLSGVNLRVLMNFVNIFLILEVFKCPVLIVVSNARQLIEIFLIVTENVMVAENSLAFYQAQRSDLIRIKPLVIIALRECLFFCELS